MHQAYAAALITAQGAGAALASSTTPTSILPGQAKYTFGAGEFQVGQTFRVTAWGKLSNLVTTPGTITWDLRLGAVVAFNAGAMQLSSTAHTDATFRLVFDFRVDSVGSGTSAKLIGVLAATSQALSLTAAADNVSTMPTLLGPATAPAVGTGFDSTAANVLDLFATFSINNAANSITLLGYVLESLN